MKFITVGWVIIFAQIGLCRAGELIVNVTDRAGHSVADVVATAKPLSKLSTFRPERPVASMDQRNLAFVPQVMVVAAGTNVDFPNSDLVSHQVYSFSPTKKFQLPLYKGVKHPPVMFDQAGIVVLGCNIHDQMAGYIYVTDAPFFGSTNAQGILRLTDIPAGDYQVTLWSPFIADDLNTLTRTVRVTERDQQVTAVQLTREQRSRPEPRPRRADWSY